MKKRSKARARTKARGHRRAALGPIRKRRVPGALALEGAMRQLKRAVAGTVSRADAVLQSSDAIAQLAVARTKHAVVQSLIDDGLLTALHNLTPGDETAPVQRMHTRWLREHFDLEPKYEPGALVEIPRSKLSSFELTAGSEIPTTDICALQIKASGWTCGKRQLCKPRASVVPFSGRGSGL